MLTYRNGLNSGWTDARVDELRALVVKGGMSAAQIAVEIGGVTRSSVLGKLNRLGITLPRQAAKPRFRKPERRGQEVNFQRRVAVKRAPPSPKDRTEKQNAAELLAQKFACNEIIDLTPEQSSTACTLLELNANTCRWPIGNTQQADFTYCGAPPYRNGRDYPYCVRHCRMAYYVRARA